jgi:hypothetical protein
VPGTRRIAALADSNVATLRHLQALEEAARAHGKELLVVRAAKAEELVPAMNDASTRGAGALNVLSSPMLFLNRRVIIERAAELRLPAVYQWPKWPKREVCSAMVRASLTFFVSAPEWSPRYSAARNRPICRSSNPPRSS